MIQRRPEGPAWAPRSSARIPSSGNAARRRPTISSSARPSISVTRFVGVPLYAMRRGRRSSARRSRPAAHAASIATRRSSVGIPLGAEAPLALLERADRSEEVDLPERRPQHVAEVELAVGALPEEEPREADLAARPDDEIGVREIGGVEVARDRVGRDALDELLQVLPLPPALSEQPPQPRARLLAAPGRPPGPHEARAGARAPGRTAGCRRE